MPKPLDLTGVKFGRLTALRPGEPYPKTKCTRWVCLCECGETTLVATGNLRNGDSTSCGCFHSQIARKIHSTHGHTKSGKHSKAYGAWAKMIGRCHNPKDNSFVHYGARGIFVCDKWRESFEAFFADMGPAPSPKHSIDRINNDESYSPTNCRWATPRQQSLNRRNTIKVNGRPLLEICEETGLKYDTALARIKRGHPPEKAVIPVYGHAYRAVLAAMEGRE